MKSVEEIVAECMSGNMDKPTAYRRQFDAIAEALRSVREAALAEGRERERADAVKWLRKRREEWLAFKAPAPSYRFLADDIEAGKHLSRVPATEEVMEDG
jgi:hypothetical protein